MIERIVEHNNSINKEGKYVLYWIQSSFFIDYNYTLQRCIDACLAFDAPLIIAFLYNNQFPNINQRNMSFCLDGLKSLQNNLQQINHELHFFENTTTFNNIINESICIVTDFSVVNAIYQKTLAMLKHTGIYYEMVDSLLISSAPSTYPKMAYSARVIRKSCHEQLKKQEKPQNNLSKIKSCHLKEYIYNDDKHISILMQLDKLTLSSQVGGMDKALETLNHFIKNNLATYGTLKKINLLDDGSRLSSYLHFAQISPLTIIEKIAPYQEWEGYHNFIEQLVVRRELAFNYVYYAKDKAATFTFLPNFAKETMRKHEHDSRVYIYTYDELLNYNTHDIYFNCMQWQLVHQGYIPNYLRMYWAKKIIEYAPTYETAFKWMLEWNDYYQLDGRDPNGLVGILWSFGLHDRAWFEREIFGTLRYMNDSGLRNKTQIKPYIDYIQTLMKLDEITIKE